MPLVVKKYSGLDFIIVGGYIMVFRQLDFIIVAGIPNVKSTLNPTPSTCTTGKGFSARRPLAPSQSHRSSQDRHRGGSRPYSCLFRVCGTDGSLLVTLALCEPKCGATGKRLCGFSAGILYGKVWSLATSTLCFKDLRTFTFCQFL